MGRLNTVHGFCVVFVGLVLASCGPTPKRTGQSQVDAGATGAQAGTTKFQVLLSRENDLELPAKEGAVDTDPVVYANGVVFRKVIQIHHFGEETSGGEAPLRPPFLVFPPDALGADPIDDALFSVRLNDDRNHPDGPLHRYPVSKDREFNRWFIPLTRILDISDADPSDVVRVTLDLRYRGGTTSTYAIDLRLRSPLPKLLPTINPVFQDIGIRRLMKANSAESEGKELPLGSWVAAEETYVNSSHARDFRLWLQMTGEWEVQSMVERRFHQVQMGPDNRGSLMPDRQLFQSKGVAVPLGVQIRREGGTEAFLPWTRPGDFLAIDFHADEKLSISWIVGPAASTATCSVTQPFTQRYQWSESRFHCTGTRGDRSCEETDHPVSQSRTEVWQLLGVQILGWMDRQVLLAPRRLNPNELMDRNQPLAVSELGGGIAVTREVGQLPASCQGLY